MPQVRGKQRERKRQRQAEGDQNRCSHILSAARIARETQEPPPKNQTSKAPKKDNVKVETESLKQNIEQIAQRRKNNQRNGFNMPQVRGMQRERQPQIQAEGD